jgi:hypothetical protein
MKARLTDAYTEALKTKKEIGRDEIQALNTKVLVGMATDNLFRAFIA